MATSENTPARPEDNHVTGRQAFRGTASAWPPYCSGGAWRAWHERPQRFLDGGIEPNRDESLMLAHVVSQLARMTDFAGWEAGAMGNDAGPLSSTF